MSKRIEIGRSSVNSSTQPRIKKLVEEITEALFEAGHEINKPLVEDIARFVYNKQDEAFYMKDYGKL